MATTDKYFTGGVHATEFYGGGSNLTGVSASTVTIASSALKAAYFDGSNQLAYETTLAPVRGGLGLDTSAATGVPSVSAGTWSTAATVSATLGGTGLNTSGTTGVPYITAGTWSSSAQLSASRGGTGIDTSAATGVPVISTGTWSTAATISATLGGTGMSTAASTGTPYIDAGSWSISNNRISKLSTYANAVEIHGFVNTTTAASTALITISMAPLGANTKSSIEGIVTVSAIRNGEAIGTMNVETFKQEIRAHYTASGSLVTEIETGKSGTMATYTLVAAFTTSDLIFNVTGGATDDVNWSGTFRGNLTCANNV
jgi:hypothetical protein